jgi:small subunit ribosomal protein S8e
MTKLDSSKRIHEVRTRGGNTKYRAIRLDTGNFAWGSEHVTRKTRLIQVVSGAFSRVVDPRSRRKRGRGERETEKGGDQGSCRVLDDAGMVEAGRGTVRCGAVRCGAVRCIVGGNVSKTADLYTVWDHTV